MTTSQPAILTIAHDPGCAISDTGCCDCDPTRKLLIGELTLPHGPGYVPLHYNVRVAKLKLVLGERKQQ